MMGGRFWSRLRRAFFGLALFILVFESVSAALPAQVFAQSNTQSKICTPENTLLVTTASVSTAFVAPYSSGLNIFDVGTKITATTTLGVGLSRVEALVYRATTTTDTWTKVGSVALSNQGQLASSWTGEYTGGLPDGAYRLFVLAKGYSKVNATETLKTQGCSTPQTLTKGKSESAKFCEGSTTAQEVGFTTSISVKPGKGGNAEKGEAAIFPLTITLQKGLRNATQPQISVKRAREGATHVLTTINPDVPLGNTTDVGTNQKAWKPEVSDKPDKAGEYRYYVFGEVTVNGKKYTTCGNAFNRWGNTDNSITDEDVSLETLRKWFAPDNVNPYTIVVPKEEGKKPFVLVSGDEESGRPDISFELAYIFGNGGNIVDTVTSPIDSRQLDWTLFEAYALRLDTNNNRVKTRIKGVYYSHDDRGIDGHVEYWANEADVATRRSDPETLQSGWDVTKESYTDLYARLYDVPKDPSSDNCLDKDGITKVGPAGKGADAEISDRGYETANLNGNCINAQDYGWAAHWGVKVTSIPLDLSKGCAVQGFLSLFSEGIGVMIAKMLGCLAASLFEGIVNSIQPLLCEAASRSMLTTPARAADSGPADCESIKNESPVQGSFNKPSLTSFFIGTAHAQNIGSNHRFEQELKNPDSVIVRIWGYSRSLLNIIVVAALLLIAFANIFHFNINTYAAKKMIPGLVIGVVAANGSLLIIRFLADVTQAVSQLAIDVSGSNGTITTLIAYHFPKAIGEAAVVGALGSLVAAGATAGVTGGVSLLAWVLLIIALVCYYAFLIIAFAIAFIKRVVVLYFLSMVAPLAFIAYGVPQFQKYFFQWWDQFLRHLFVFPVILFGMAATVALASQLGIADYANVLNPTNFISGLVSIILVMSAATMVLKLPKIFTKGAIDVAETFKKVIGAAPRIAQTAQGVHSYVNGKRIDNLTKTYQFEKDKGTPEGRRKAAEARLARIKLSNKVSKDAGKLKKFRGYSTLFARPELLKEAWEARGARDKKDDYIGAMVRTGGIPGMLRGAAAEAELARKLGLDESKDARTIGDLQDLSKTLFEGHIKAVENDLKIKEAMEIASGNDPAEFEKLRQKASNFKSKDEIDAFIKMLSEKSGMDLKVGTVKDYHDIMKWSAFQTAITRVARGIRDTEEGIDPYLKNANKVAMAYPDYSKSAGAGGPGAVPFAGVGPAAQASATRIASFTDQQIQDRVEEIFSHGLALDPNLGDDIQEKFVKNLDALTELEAMNPGDAIFTSALEKTRQTLLDAVGTSAGAEADALREAIRQANDPAQLTRLTENLSMAAEARRQGGDTKESVASIVAQATQGTREFNKAHEALISTTDISRLESAITSSLQAGGQDMADVLSRELGDGVNKLSQTLGKQLNPEEQRKMFQQLATQIQGTMVGPGQKTLRAVLQSSLQSLPKTFAKVVGVHTLNARAMETKVVNQPAPPPPQPPTPPPPASS
jgi:hypothetical protein